MTSRAFWIRIAGVAAVLSLALVPSRAEAEPRTTRPWLAPDFVNRYIGAERCTTCHADAETGDQCGKWAGFKHARAYEVLGTPEAHAVAAKLDIDNPQTSDACMRCHQTGFGKPTPMFQPAFDPLAGVQCETCHGPGERHMMARLMGATEDGVYPDIPAGELTPVTSAMCLECHNEESPTYQPFCPHERMSKIRHLNPKKPRTDAERAALDDCTCEQVCICRAETEDGTCRDAAKSEAGAAEADGDDEG